MDTVKEIKVLLSGVVKAMIKIYGVVKERKEGVATHHPLMRVAEPDGLVE